MTDNNIEPSELDAQTLLQGLREYAKDDRDGFTRGLTNPVTEKYQRLENLSEDGYCRRFLELLLLLDNPDIVDLGSSPYLTFDKDRWELEERESTIILKKQESETRLDEMVLSDE